MRRAAYTAVAVLIALVTGVLLVPVAPAEEQQDPVAVVLTGLAPVSLGLSETMSVTGSVSNTGLTDLGSVSVRLTLSSVPLAERSAIRQVADGGAGIYSLPLYDTDTPIADVLAPGVKEGFRVSVRTSQLPLPAPGIYALGVEVVGYGSSGYVILGTATTLVPYVPAGTAPVNLTWLWPLSTWPGQTPGGVLLGDLIPREVSTDGRLRDLLDVGGSSTGVSWIVDPQVLQVVDEMTDGYLVEKGGEIRPGTAQQSATEWMRTARQVLGTEQKVRAREPASPPDVWSLPYADIDADAVVRARMETDVVRAVTSGPAITQSQLGRPSDGTIAWAPGGRIDPAALEVLVSSGVRAVVLREGAAPPVIDSPTTPSGYTDIDTAAGAVRALLIDPGLLDALTMPQRNQAQILAARQRFLAELAFVALEPSASPRNLIAAAGSTRWDPNPRLLRSLLASLKATPWARLVPVETVLNLPPSPVVRAVAGYESKSRSRELTDAYLGRVERASDDLDSLRGVTTQPLAITEPVRSALLRSESSAWRTRPSAGVALIEETQATIDAQIAELYVIPREGVTLSGDRGSVPVTVANDFDQAVVVGVTLTGSPAARLDAAALSGVQIEPGRKASLEMPVRIVGGDPLSVTVQLVDSRGKAFGLPTTMELRTTAYSRAALWFAMAAAAVLVLLVVYDIVRRARQRRPGAAT